MFFYHVEEKNVKHFHHQTKLFSDHKWIKTKIRVFCNHTTKNDETIPNHKNDQDSALLNNMTDCGASCELNLASLHCFCLLENIDYDHL